MNQEVNEVKFYNDTLLGVKDADGQVWLGVKKVCLDIGLSEGQAQRQLTNLQNDIIISSNCCKFAIVQLEGKREIEREVIAIKEEFVTLWLAKISLTPAMQRTNPIAVQKLIKYQLEAQKVLHEAFLSSDSKKEAFYSSMGIQGQIADISSKMDNMTSKIDILIDSSTINTSQQQKLYCAAKDRINFLLGGVRSAEYKKHSKKYFINLWNGFKAIFKCGSYKDLNPMRFEDAVKYIDVWDYK